MAYDMQITFREQWNDSRLAYGKPNDGLPSFIILNKEQDIWRPDTFFAVKYPLGYYFFQFTLEREIFV